MFVQLDLVCKDKTWVDHILGPLQRYIAQSRLVSDPGIYILGNHFISPPPLPLKIVIFYTIDDFWDLFADLGKINEFKEKEPSNFGLKTL